MKSNSAHWCFSSFFKQRHADNFCLFLWTLSAPQFSWNNHFILLQWEKWSLCPTQSVLFLTCTFTWKALSYPQASSKSQSSQCGSRELSTPRQQWSRLSHSACLTGLPITLRPRLVYIKWQKQGNCRNSCTSTEDSISSTWLDSRGTWTTWPMLGAGLTDGGLAIPLNDSGRPQHCSSRAILMVANPALYKIPEKKKRPTIKGIPYL